MIVAVFSLLIIVAITMLITRLAAMVLVLTGTCRTSRRGSKPDRPCPASASPPEKRKPW